MPIYKCDGTQLTLKMWITPRLHHCNSEIRAQLNYLIKIYLYLHDPVFYLLTVQLGISFKDAGIVCFDCAKFYIMFNINFTKYLFLCEIIERHEIKSIVVVVKL